MKWERRYRFYEIKTAIFENPEVAAEAACGLIRGVADFGTREQLLEIHAELRRVPRPIAREHYRTTSTVADVWLGQASRGMSWCSRRFLSRQRIAFRLRSPRDETMPRSRSEVSDRIKFLGRIWWGTVRVHPEYRHGVAEFLREMRRKAGQRHRPRVPICGGSGTANLGMGPRDQAKDQSRAASSVFVINTAGLGRTHAVRHLTHTGIFCDRPGYGNT